MIKRLPVQEMSEENKFKSQFSSWIHDSHYWIESSNSHMQCKWCGQFGTNTPSTNICMQNPKILEIIQQTAKKYSNYEII